MAYARLLYSTLLMYLFRSFLPSEHRRPRGTGMIHNAAVKEGEQAGGREGGRQPGQRAKPIRNAGPRGYSLQDGERLLRTGNANEAF